jgi:hypothetical protein
MLIYPTSFEYLIRMKSDENGRVTPKQTGVKGLITCPTGYSFTPDNKQCFKAESPTECYDREIKPYKSSYLSGLDDCKAKYFQDTERLKLKMADWRAHGSYTLGLVLSIANEVFATVGAIETGLGRVGKMIIGSVIFTDKNIFAGKLTLHWATYMNGVENAYNYKYLADENACFELYERTYAARKTWVTNDCK